MPTRAPSTPAVTKIDVRGSPKRSVGLRTRRRAPVVGASPERESSRSPDTPSVASEAPVTFPRTEKLGRTQRERSSWTEDQTVYRNQKRETDGSNMTCLKSLIGGKHPLVSQVAVGAGAFEPGRRSDERLSCRVEPHCLPSSATRTLQMPHVLPPQKSMSYRSRIRVPPTTLQNPWKNMFFQPARGNRSNILGAPRPLSEKVTWVFHPLRRFKCHPQVVFHPPQRLWTLRVSPKPPRTPPSKRTPRTSPSYSLPLPSGSRRGEDLGEAPAVGVRSLGPSWERLSPLPSVEEDPS